MELKHTATRDGRLSSFLKEELKMSLKREDAGVHRIPAFIMKKFIQKVYNLLKAFISF